MWSDLVLWGRVKLHYVFGVARMAPLLPSPTAVLLSLYLTLLPLETKKLWIGEFDHHFWRKKSSNRFPGKRVYTSVILLIALLHVSFQIKENVNCEPEILIPICGVTSASNSSFFANSFRLSRAHSQTSILMNSFRLSRAHSQSFILMELVKWVVTSSV